jgi:hypothetical protein
MKNKEKFSVVVPVFDVLVEVYLCKYEKLPDYMKNGEEIKTDGYAGFTITAEKKGVPSKVCIWVDDFRWTSPDMATLVHELSHAVDKIALYKNFTLETETRAYLLDYLVEKFFLNIGREFNPSKFKKKS